MSRSGESDGRVDLGPDRAAICWRCHGEGSYEQDGLIFEECEWCDGRGLVPLEIDEFDEIEEEDFRS